MCLAICATAEPAVHFYVSPFGKDTWSGTIPTPDSSKEDGPFATLEAARDAIRALKKSNSLNGPAEVILMQGFFIRETSFELTAEDSGTAEAPVVYRGESTGAARVVGGRKISGFHPIIDEAQRARLQEPARENVLVVDLRDQGVTEFGEMSTRGFGRPIQAAGLELFFNGKAMTMARWPNEGFAKIAAVPAEPDAGRFTYSEDRPSTWKNTGDIWIHGYWTWDWAESYEHVKSINPETREIETHAPHGVYGYKEGKRYYALNVFEELDQPGEWYLDRAAGLLYFWPPATLENAEVIVSTLAKPMIVANGLEHARFQNLSLECGRDSGIVLNNSRNVIVENSVIANFGTVGVIVDGTAADTGVFVQGCDLYGLGEGGISLAGGERKTLRSGGNAVVGNRIHDFSRWVYTYRPGVSLSGVGNRVANNEIYDAPHSAIIFGGNEHAIEYNDIHHICMDTHDAGAIYMGRDWTQRGNRIQFNYLHELGAGDVNAVYLDDWSSGTIVYGNVCVRAGRGVLLGGGRDNLIENNLFIECRPGIHIDARGLGWAKNYFDGTTTTLFDRFKDMNAAEPPYSDKYPELKVLLSDEPAIAKGNRVISNVNFGGRWLDLLDGMNDKIIEFSNNWTDGDPGFEDASKGLLKADSPVFKLGFKPLPYGQIGLPGANQAMRK